MSDIAVIRKAIPPVSVKDMAAILDVLVQSGLATSKSEARKLIEGKGVYLQGELVESIDARIATLAFTHGIALLRRGKQTAILAIEK